MQFEQAWRGWLDWAKPYINAVGLARSPVAVHSGRAGLRFPGRDSPQATADAETSTARNRKCHKRRAGAPWINPNQSWSSPDCIPGSAIRGPNKCHQPV